MRRRFPALWIPLLTALLVGSLVESPRNAWDEIVLRRTDASSHTIGYPLPVARIQPKLHSGFPIERHGGQLWSILPAGPVARIASPSLYAHSPELNRGPLTLSARHLPLFPTGPPSHS